MSGIQNTVLSVVVYILQSVFLTFKIIFGIFFPLILSCMILNVLAKEQNKRLLHIGGWKALLVTSWIGTPIHELSHYLAAVVANHRIIDLQLFKPDKRTGSLGYLTHTYQEDNFYQAVIGNTLIAIAPFFGGSAVIYLISTIVFPHFSLFTNQVPHIYFLNLDTIFDWNSYLLFFKSHFNFFKFLMSKIFSSEMLHSWKLYVFLFLMFGIANHLSPSRTDFKNLWQPAIILMVTLILLSLIIYPLIKNSDVIITSLSNYIFIFIPILYLAVFISALWLVLTYIVYFLVTLFR